MMAYPWGIFQKRFMMTSWHGNAFCTTEFPWQMVGDVELWYFLCCKLDQAVDLDQNLVISVRKKAVAYIDDQCKNYKSALMIVMHIAVEWIAFESAFYSTSFSMKRTKGNIASVMLQIITRKWCQCSIIISCQLCSQILCMFYYLHNTMSVIIPIHILCCLE